MFSTPKLLVAAAVMALAAGLASVGLLNTPTAQPGAQAPWQSHYLQAEEFTEVTGTARFTPSPNRIIGVSTMSDPRVSGTWTGEYEYLCIPDESCTTWGTAVLDAEGGTWEGSWVAFNGPGPANEQHNMVWMAGTGEYEGLSYIVNFEGPMNDSEAIGRIVDSPLPPEVSLQLSEDFPR